MNRLKLKIISLLVISASILVYQNCSRVQFSTRSPSSSPAPSEVVTDLSTPEPTAVVESLPKNCNLDGQTILHGNSVTAFATRTVAAGSSCSSMSRNCRDGVLDGSASFQFSSCLPEVGVPCSAKTVSYANGTCTASLPSTAEGQSQTFNCTGRGIVNNTYKCEYPYVFIGHQYTQGSISLNATCTSGGVWSLKESMSGSNSCLETGSLYDCYQWIYQGTNGQILTSSSSTYQVYNIATSELLTYPENNSCCSKKVRLDECQDVGNGNKSCKAFCID